MTRTAVLISGEYRKFDITRKSMQFLDSTDVDVYVSTWNKTTLVNDDLQINYSRSIDKSTVMADLQRPATVLIEDISAVTSDLYNAPMVHRWIRGFELIQNSNIQYDYVMILRPDIYFSRNTRLRQLTDVVHNYRDSVGFCWAQNVHQTGRLSDVIFLSSYTNIETLLGHLTVDAWENGTEKDWHRWWYNYVSPMLDIVHLTECTHFTFCRHWVQPHHTYSQISGIQDDWRDATILLQIKEHGAEFAATIWPLHDITSAAEKQSTDYFFKTYGCRL